MEENELCNTVTGMAKRLCSTYVDPKGLTGFVACSLIALDKGPGIRPIGVGEVLCRIVVKTVLQIVAEDILPSFDNMVSPSMNRAGSDGYVFNSVVARTGQRRSTFTNVDFLLRLLKALEASTSNSPSVASFSYISFIA